MTQEKRVHGQTGKPKNQPGPMLKALRHVANRPAEEDVTDLHKMLREIRNSKPENFLDRLQKAEGIHKLAGSRRGVGRPKEVRPAPAAPAPAQVEVCESTERVLERIEDLLASKPWEQESR